MKTQKHTCLLDGNRTHIYWTAYDYRNGESASGRTEQEAIDNWTVQRDCRMEIVGEENHHSER